MNVYPTFEEFVTLSQKGNLIPVCYEVAADMETPVSAYYKLTQSMEQNPNDDYAFLLESVEGGENIARYSIIGTDPKAVFLQQNGVAKLTSDGNSSIVEGKDVFEKISRVLEKYKPVEIEGLPPFSGGAVGYTSYDVISEVETTVEQPSSKALDVPEAYFMVTDSLLVFDHVRHTIKIIFQAFIDMPENVEKIYNQAIERINDIIEKLRQPLSVPPVNLDSKPEALEFDSNKTREEFYEMVNKAKQYIYDGDIIQAVLSQRFSTKLDAPPIAVHRALRMVNPSPYMFLLKCKDIAIVGASPEVHAKCEHREITIRPIAGTRWRGKTQQEDLELEKDLLADPKERAEHIMLVDLARNDIGRIAVSGSVSVDELMTVERYSHVMHIVSNVKGTLDEQYQADAVMRSTFPAGTLTGAPKVRAMQIISELEKEQRGPYGGAVAYFSFNGNLDSCITIRTAVLKDGYAYVQAGGGIVADSDPEYEFNESCNKAKGMMKALALAKIFA